MRASAHLMLSQPDYQFQEIHTYNVGIPETPTRKIKPAPPSQSTTEGTPDKMYHSEESSVCHIYIYMYIVFFDMNHKKNETNPCICPRYPEE